MSVIKPLTSVDNLSHHLQLLSIKSSLHPNQQYLQDKLDLLQKTTTLANHMLKEVSTPFSPKDAASTLTIIREQEKTLKTLVTNLSKEFDRLNLNTLSALNLDSPSHQQSKKQTYSLLDALNIEQRKVTSNYKIKIKLNTFGFDPLSNPEERLTQLHKRLSKAFSYITTPLEHLIYSRSQLTDNSIASMPKATLAFIQKTLRGCSIISKGQLGKGYFGSVDVVQSEQTLFALKNPLKPSSILLLSKRKLEQKQLEMEVSLKKETSLYMTFNHPNIVSIAAASPEGLYLELMDGTLHDLIKSSGFKEKDVKKCLSDILHGLIYLHERGYTYKDLKPKNILISKLPIKAKLCDFGLTTPTEKDTCKSGSAYYLAPEILSSSSKNPTLISNKADIWSLGVVIFQMITGGTYPFPTLKDEKEEDYFKRISKYQNKPCNTETVFGFLAPLTEKLMEQQDPTGRMRYLVIKCLHGDPTKRLSAEEVLSIFHSDESYSYSFKKRLL